MNWEQLQANYATAQNELQSYEKYMKQRSKITDQITEVEREQQNYEAQLLKAQHMYEKLETRSILNFLRDFTGKREDLIEQKLEKIAQLELQLVEAKHMQKDLQQDLKVISEKLQRIDQANINEELQQLRVQMQVWLMANAPQISEQLTQIIDEELLSKRLIIEIDEAITAGLQAEESLRQATDKIREADGFSTWDVLGGGFIITALKHSALNESNSAIHEVQIALQRFKNELLDIQEIRREEMYVNVDGLVQFTDYVFDDFFSDWIVHSKIGKAKTHIEETLDDVIGTIQDLRLKRNVVEDKMKALFEQKEIIFSQQTVQ